MSKITIEVSTKLADLLTKLNISSCVEESIIRMLAADQLEPGNERRYIREWVTIKKDMRRKIEALDEPAEYKIWLTPEERDNLGPELFRIERV